MKLIIFLAIVAAVGGVGYWYITNNPDVVESVREGLSQDPTVSSSGTSSDQASGSQAETRRATVPAAVPTVAPSSSRDIRFVYDSRHSAGVSSQAVGLMREDMLDMINAQRSRTGASPVTLGSNRSAQAHAEYMRDNCIVSHTGAGGSSKRDRWVSAGGNANVTLGENVNGYRDCSFTIPSSRTLYHYVDKLMDSLMDSSGHREILLTNSYDEVHLGFAISPNGMWVTQVFVNQR